MAVNRLVVGNRFSQVKSSRSMAIICIELPATLLTIWGLYGTLAQFLVWITDGQALIASLQRLGVWGEMLLFALLVLQVFIALIPGHALVLAGGYVYGFGPCLLITLCSTVLGSQIAFFIGRRYGRSVVDRLANPQVIQRWNRLSANQGIIFFFFAFLLPIFPNDMMCYVAGLGKISARRFFVANVLGRSVAASFVTLIGANGMRMPPAFWAAVVLGMMVLFAAWRVYSRRNRITLGDEK